MEGALSAIRSNLTPLEEYILQGSILEASRDMLLHRIIGLCDAVESGPEKFDDHEMVFAMRGSPSAQPIQFRVRHALSNPDAPWHLRYVGTPDTGDKSRHTMVRNCVDVGVSDNIVQFLLDLGFKLDHEFVIRGYVFKKGRMKATVSKVMKMLQAGNTDNLQAQTQSCLVELSVVTTQGQDQVQEDMKNFAEQLKPLVVLEKVDYRRLQ